MESVCFALFREEQAVQELKVHRGELDPKEIRFGHSSGNLGILGLSSLTKM